LLLRLGLGEFASPNAILKGDRPCQIFVHRSACPSGEQVDVWGS
jgi:hypothetical protein